MIISIDLDYPISSEPLLVEIKSSGIRIEADLSQFPKKIHLEPDLPICNQTVNLILCCDDIRIMQHPVTITDIVLDGFYRSPGILHRGHTEFNQQFLLLAAKQNMYLDLETSDSNRLDFTGNLVYEFVWPFYKNIYR